MARYDDSSLTDREKHFAFFGKVKPENKLTSINLIN